MLMWLSVRSEVQIVCIWSSWCCCHPKTPSSLASFKSRLVLPFWYRLTQVVLEKEPLNGCNSSTSSWVGMLSWKKWVFSNHLQCAVLQKLAGRLFHTDGITQVELCETRRTCPFSWSQSLCRPISAEYCRRDRPRPLSRSPVASPPDQAGSAAHLAHPPEYKNTAAILTMSSYQLWLGTNLIHGFTAVTFSVKLAFFRENAYFREICDFFLWISMLLLSFMKVSEFYEQHLSQTVTLDCLESWLSIYICSKYSLCRNFKCTIRQIS